MIEKNIKRQFDHMKVEHPDDKLAAIDNNTLLSGYEKSYLDYLRKNDMFDEFARLVGVNPDAYLSNPTNFTKVYNDLKQFKDYLSKKQSFAKHISFDDQITYDPILGYWKVGNIASGGVLQSFINDIKLRFNDDVKFNTDNMSAELGYSDRSNIFNDNGGGVIGSYYPDIDKIVVQPMGVHDTASTLLHEAYSHKTDKQIPKED